MKKSIFQSHFIFLPLILVPFVLSGCTHQATLDKATTKVKEQTQQASDAATNAASGAITNAADAAVGKAVNEAKEATSEQVNRASEAVQDATNTIKDTVDGEGKK